MGCGALEMGGGNEVEKEEEDGLLSDRSHSLYKSFPCVDK